MIGIACRILDGLVLKVHSPRLTHKVLVILIAEIVAIMNAIVCMSSYPNKPTMLTPAMLKHRWLTWRLLLDLKDLYWSQWKQIQGLPDSSWK